MILMLGVSLQWSRCSRDYIDILDWTRCLLVLLLMSLVEIVANERVVAANFVAPIYLFW